MKIKNFMYLKEGVAEPKPYELLVLKEDAEHEYGIALSTLTEEEKEKVIGIVTAYEEALKPYMKAWRNFIRIKMLTKVE